MGRRRRRRGTQANCNLFLLLANRKEISSDSRRSALCCTHIYNNTCMHMTILTAAPTGILRCSAVGPVWLHALDQRAKVVRVQLLVFCLQRCHVSHAVTSQSHIKLATVLTNKCIVPAGCAGVSIEYGDVLCNHSESYSQQSLHSTS